MISVVLTLWFIAGALSVEYLEEGDECSSSWRCKKLSECTSARQDLSAGRSPRICSFQGMLPIVCCRPEKVHGSAATDNIVERWPTETTTTTTRRPRPSSKKSISQRKCEEYAEYVFTREQVPTLSFDPQFVKKDECRRIEEPLIVGGTDAKAREFPHMTQIGYDNVRNNEIAWLCGGSLISEQWVLSAAHCTNPDRKGPAKHARIGDLDTLSDTDGAKPVVLDIILRVNHPGYKGIQLYNDIALYKLSRNVQLSPYIRPLCLPVSRNDDLSPLAIATGWGHTEWNGRSTNMLQKVSLDIVDGRTCNESYNDVKAQLPAGISDSLMLCANADGKDTCQGDSGGPLQIALRTPYCMYSQIGVTSFGRACASGNPGVYTRVSAYVPWIESIVWPNE